MSEAELVQIADASGLTFNAWLVPTPGDATIEQVLLKLTDGTQFMIPNELLRATGEGRYTLGVSLREYARDPTAAEAVLSAAPSYEGLEEAGSRAALVDDQAVIQLAEETLRVGKRIVERGQVRVVKRVVERQETVDQPLLREEIAVERVPIHQVVEQASPVRYEGDTTIIPLYEEVLVFEKRLMLVEEVRVTRRQTERYDPQTVILRREEVVVERDGAGAKNHEE